MFKKIQICVLACAVSVLQFHVKSQKRLPENLKQPFLNKH